MFQITRPLLCINLSPEQWLNPIRPVLIAKEGGDARSNELVVLKVFAGGRTYLAALADQHDRVIEWLEIWVQCTHDLDSSPLARSATINNALHDKSWQDAVESMRGLDAGNLIETDWEKMPRTPLVVDLNRLTVVPLVQATSKNSLELCRDDAVLKAAGLSHYSSTLERWFFSKSANGDIAWFSLKDLLQPNAGERVAVPESGADSAVADFNLSAGLMLVCKHHPVSLEGFVTWLNDSAPGATQAPERDYASPVEHTILAEFQRRQATVPSALGDPVMEAVFLRLQLWLMLAREVYSLSSRRKAPFLNLSSESFRVSPRPSSLLEWPAAPFRPVLVHPGESIAVKLGESDVGFAPLRGTLATNHALPKFGGCLEGTGTLRVRQVTDTGEGRVRLEGILDGNELKNAPAGSFVWVQTMVDGRSVSFYAKTEADRGSTRAGMPGMGFSVPSSDLPTNTANRLRAAARLPCQFLILRPVDPRFDIYSLGVIAVRIFLTEDPMAVNELVDDLFELASLLPPNESIADIRRIAGSPDLSERLRRLLTPPFWTNVDPEKSGLSEGIWLSVLKELMDFVTIDSNSDSGADSKQAQTWLETMAERVESLEQLSAQLKRVLGAPRCDHEEVARIVHSFI